MMIPMNMLNIATRRPAHACALLALLLCTGCQTAYYATMDKLGYEKSEILVDRVEDARDSQHEAKEQFQTALERFMEVVNVDGGDLRKKYDKLAAELDRSESRADAVRSEIASVENVAKALFREWRSDLAQYSNPSLRAQSEQLLDDTEQRYADLIGTMRRAESTMEPVLNAFQDQVLFLKHHLNAHAIASLQGTAVELESNIETLIRDMEAAIAEADAFIAVMSP